MAYPLLRTELFTYSLAPAVEDVAGAFVEEIPLDIPPGRNGIAPEVTLSYNSQELAEDNIAGYGWSLSIPHIERLNKTGSERLYVDNYFTSSLGGELATTTTEVEFSMLMSGGSEVESAELPSVSAFKSSAEESPSENIENLLENKTAAEKADIKGQEIAKIGSVEKTEREEYSIEIVGLNGIESGVEVFARAWWPNGEQIGFGKDGSVDIERFIIKNPPILVPDANGNIVREWIDEDTRELKQRKLREDLREALLQSLEHTIKVKKEKFGAENIVEGKVGNTTLTAYPNAGTGTAPVDGVVRRSGVDLSWSNIRTGSGTGALNTQMNDNYCIILAHDDGGWQDLRRGLFGFDT